MQNMGHRFGLYSTLGFVIFAGWTLMFTDAVDTAETVGGCVSNLDRGDIPNAIEKFKTMNFEQGLSALPLILSDAYKGVVESVHTILNFIKNLPSCKHQEVAYPDIYNRIKDNGQHWGSELFRIDVEMETCDNSSSVREEIRDWGEKVERDWAGRVQEVYWRSQLHRETQNGCSSYMLRHWRGIISNAYKGLETVDDVVDFIKQANCNESKIKMLRVLLEEMENRSDLEQVDSKKVADMVWRIFREDQVPVQNSGRSENVSVKACLSYRFVNYSDSKFSPASEDYDRVILHSCRLYAYGDILPGVRFPTNSSGICKTIYDGTVYTEEYYRTEVLNTEPGANFQWVRSSSLPPNAVAGGQTKYGETLYVVRCEFRSMTEGVGMRPGYYQPSAGAFIYKGVDSRDGKCESEPEFLVCN